MNIQEFPEEVIALNKELATPYHPVLQKLMYALDPATSFAERLAHIAAYCGVIVDGMYDSDQIVNLCGILRDKLIAKRENPNQTIHINSELRGPNDQTH